MTFLHSKLFFKSWRLNPVWHGDDIFIPLSLLDQIFQKFPNFFGGEKLYQSGYFDTLLSSLSLIKVVVWRLSKDEHFPCFPSSCQTGLKLSIIPKLLLIVDNLFDMLVEEIYAGSSVLGPKVYILSTVKTQMNLSHPNLNATLATDQKWPLVVLPKFSTMPFNIVVLISRISTMVNDTAQRCALTVSFPVDSLTVINPLEKKLAKHISMDWAKLW